MSMLITKHFIVDFFLQSPYQYLNKGTLGHPGGLLHAGLHGVATALVFATFIPWQLAVILGWIDSVVHYWVDFSKVWFTAKYNWASADRNFWLAVGFDQFLHYATYVSLVLMVI